MSGSMWASERWPLSSSEEKSSFLDSSSFLRLKENVSIKSTNSNSHRHPSRRFWAVGALLATLGVVFLLSYCRVRLASNSVKSSLAQRSLASGGGGDDPHTTAFKDEQLCAGLELNEEQEEQASALTGSSHSSGAHVGSKGNRLRKRKGNLENEEDKGSHAKKPFSFELPSRVSSPLAFSLNFEEHLFDWPQQFDTIIEDTSSHGSGLFVDEEERSSAEEGEDNPEALIEFYIQQALNAEGEPTLDPSLFDLDLLSPSSPQPGTSQHLRGEGQKREQEDFSHQAASNNFDASADAKRKKTPALPDASALQVPLTAATGSQPCGSSAVVAEGHQQDENGGDSALLKPEQIEYTPEEVLPFPWDEQLDLYADKALQGGGLMLESWLLNPEGQVPPSPPDEESEGEDEAEVVEGSEVQTSANAPSTSSLPPHSVGDEVSSRGFGAAGTHIESEGEAAKPSTSDASADAGQKSSSLLHRLRPDYTHHPFYRLPLVLSSIDRSSLWRPTERALDNADPFPILKAIQDILMKPIVNLSDLESLQFHAIALRHHIHEHWSKPLRFSLAHKVARNLSLRFLMADALWCACEVLGPSMLKEAWWEELMSKMLDTAESLPNSLLEARRSKRQYLALRLLHALEFYKEGRRPSALEVVQLKQEIFCAEEPMPYFQNSRWDAWRKADKYYQPFKWKI